jgi:hypothetical protein
MLTFQYYVYENAPEPDNALFLGSGCSLTFRATKKQDKEQDINPVYFGHTTL